jgi:CubicO group peptidase (beta-lactamase class C family)
MRWMAVPVLLLAVLAMDTPLKAADSDALPGIRARIASGEFPSVHSVIVVKDGATLAEWYFEGQDEIRGRSQGRVKFGPDTLHDIRSATKSIVSLLFGIAVEERAIPSLDAPVLDYFPEYRDLQTPERRAIRLRDLLTMTSGLHWDEDTHPYTDSRNSETAMDLARDRLRFVLSQKLEARPGTRWRYSGGDVAVIAAVLERATKRTLADYAREKLFTPLGINRFEWLQDARGTYLAASGLRMLPRDMAVIGQMMLDGGAYRGRQIVARDWVAASTTQHSVLDTAPGCGTAYGYFWWLGPACPADVAWYAAIGNGGQRIFVVPGNRLVIVVTAGLYNKPEQRRVREIVRAVIAAVGSSGSAPAPAPASR